MLSSYFANYLPFSRHHRTHKNGPRDNDSPNPLRLQPPVTPQQQSMVSIFLLTALLIRLIHIRGLAALNQMVVLLLMVLFSMNNDLCSRCQTCAHRLLPAPIIIIPTIYKMSTRYHLSPENGSTVNTNIPTAKTLHATNAWSN